MTDDSESTDTKMELEIDVKATTIEIDKGCDDYNEYYILLLKERWSDYHSHNSKEIKVKLNDKQLDNLIEMLKKAKEINIDEPPY